MLFRFSFQHVWCLMQQMYIEIPRNRHLHDPTIHILELKANPLLISSTSSTTKFLVKLGVKHSSRICTVFRSKQPKISPVSLTHRQSSWRRNTRRSSHQNLPRPERCRKCSRCHRTCLWRHHLRALLSSRAHSPHCRHQRAPTSSFRLKKNFFEKTSNVKSTRIQNQDDFHFRIFAPGTARYFKPGRRRSACVRCKRQAASYLKIPEKIYVSKIATN